MKTFVLVTGGFDPLHRGHIAYFEAAAKLGDALIVGLNSDEWLQRKKGKHFMDFDDRRAVLESLRMVDEVMPFDDRDGSARDAIERCLDWYPYVNLVFANGGDRTEQNIPEMTIEDKRLTFEFGVGGVEKLNSSSAILERWEK